MPPRLACGNIVDVIIKPTTKPQLAGKNLRLSRAHAENVWAPMSFSAPDDEFLDFLHLLLTLLV
jgi:hypothetical protein